LVKRGERRKSGKTTPKDAQIRVKGNQAWSSPPHQLLAYLGATKGEKAKGK